MLAKKRIQIYSNRVPRKKTPKQMERHLKGISNHRRIEIIFLIAKNKGITVESISERLECNIKTISGHIWRLTQAGLVNKKYQGRTVTHKLSPYGKILVNFLKTFQNSTT